MKQLWVVATVLLSGCTGNCNTPGPPAPDSCESPGVGSATSLTLLTADGDPIANGQVMPLVYGSQGGEMIVIELQLVGDVPGCIAQESAVYHPGTGDEIYLDDEPRKTYPDGSARVTRQIYLPLFGGYAVPGASVRVVGRAAGLEAERSVYLDFVALPDAGTDDAGTDDAGADDAGADDAGVADAL